ncbi:uncharacterized protein At2g27730, mitochondrial [Cryptomeria japonica]|uniref:uncharacterized protein At2g27730, mitochondrial n=1 Tax=Cryptomeria japonica TaxID=3369 RepID=UPI0027DA7584|nr:uncharacterized protein At2g27730, mitochondrial [Cryptomeria japonica]XP_057841451.2 uncharacterized protein At2g27730, mitochondrial [Cryptomeria japonica]
MASLGKMYGKRVMGVQRQAFRAFYTRSKDKVLGEEERALETVYIQKMEREKLEKTKKRVAKEKSGVFQVGGSAVNQSAERIHATG